LFDGLRFASRPFSALPVIAPLATKSLTMAINSSTVPVDVTGSAVDVAMLDGVSEGDMAVEVPADPQEVMKMVNINMASSVVIFFIILSPILY